MRPSASSIEGVSERYAGKLRVLSVADPNALTQAIGWLKFTADGGEVLYRGQTELFTDLRPSGLRGRNEQGRVALAASLRDYIAEMVGECTCHEASSFGKAQNCDERVNSRTRRSPIVSKTYRAAIEPLLQHYGLRTRWLDVVDNVWVALWFACHSQHTNGRFAYHLRRSVATEGATAKAYIAVLDTGALRATDIPGYRVGPRSRVVDLRYAVPSVYLRPHAQHGLLIAPPKLPPKATGTLTGLVGSVIEVSLNDALEWLGAGAMLSTFVLFPPAARDEGYRRLLEYASEPPKKLGSITQYGPGY